MISATEGCVELTTGGESPKLGLDVGSPGGKEEIHEDDNEWTLSPKMKIR